RGVPVLTTDYGGTQLRFYDTGVPILLQHLRLRHGYSGILFEGNNPDNTVRHCQFVHCRYPVQNTSDSIVRLQNVLIDAVKSLGFAFSGAGTPFTGEHLTIHNVPNLQNGAILRLTNSFIVAVSAVQVYSGSGNHESSSAAGLFEAVGAGHFYLPP